MDRNEDEVVMSQSAHDALMQKQKAEAEAAAQAAVANAKAEGGAEAGKAAQARIKSILGSEAAKGRQALAEHLAFDSDMSVEAATAILEKSPKGGATTPSIERRMGGQGADLALVGPMGKPKGEAEAAAQAELNPAAVYGARAKARSQRALN